MSTTETLALALALEVSLDVDPETLEITADPGRHVTPELAEAITENREDVIRSLLFKKCVSWLHEKEVDHDAAHHALESHSDELETVWAEGTLEEFRAFLRGVAGEAYKKGKRKAPFGTDPDKAEFFRGGAA